MQEYTAVVQAGCKINLFLRITGVRPNGWHDLDTLFLPLPRPYDTLTLTLRQQQNSTCTVHCTTEGIDNKNNTLTTAYAYFAAKSDFAPSVEIVLHKGIQHGAGLGGGSSDAAVLLAWLNALAPKPLTPASLMKVAANVGADVPFFLYNRPCRARGIGERLTPCDPLFFLRRNGAALVLLCPAEFVSTRWAYAAWDQWQEHGKMALTKTEGQYIGQSSLCFPDDGGEVLRIENSFEQPVFSTFPRLRRLKEMLLQYGAAAAAMSGSGSSLFGLFRSRALALAAAQNIRGNDVAVYVHTV